MAKITCTVHGYIPDESDQSLEAAAFARAVLIMLDATKLPSSVSSCGVTPSEPDDLDTYGEHRMANSSVSVDSCECGNILKRTERFKPDCGHASGPTTVGKPKEPSADCTCGMGIGASSHYYECPSYIGTIGSGFNLSWSNGQAKPVSLLANPSSSADGSKADTEAEHSASVKDTSAVSSSNGSDYRGDGLSKPMERSCRKCGVADATVKAGSPAPFYIAYLAGSSSSAPKPVIFCGPCYSLVFP